MVIDIVVILAAGTLALICVLLEWRFGRIVNINTMFKRYRRK